MRIALLAPVLLLSSGLCFGQASAPTAEHVSLALAVLVAHSAVMLAYPMCSVAASASGGVAAIASIWPGSVKS